MDITGLDPGSGRGVRVRAEHGLITAVEDAPEVTGDWWLAPGLVDLQVNGFAGHDLNAPGVEVDTVLALTAALREHGVTTFAPTLVTAPEHRITRALAVIAQARRVSPAVRHAIPHVHVEGPHLSTEDGPRGAHDPAWMRPPRTEEFHRWQQACDGLVGMVTLSPHHPDSTAYIAELRRHGVHAAIGHTHCTPEQVEAAVEAGATVSTHLGNGAHAVLPRHPNYLWTQLAEDRLMAGFIADGHHLPAAALTAMLRAKGPHRSFLVSDSVALAGLPPGTYTTPVGGQVELTASGRLGKAGTPFLAGAARCLADGVAEVVALTGIGLAEALRLATENPARLLPPGTGAPRGVLRPGAAADLVRFRWAPGDHHLTFDKELV
ncbi:N-acetylglucosamine-6-phosphate deacetylase [Crossiella equi]|uniref:N-acetylglucosamine-6-phosphate deacetylase n=1 Tax=Crossiella equi TaxID=130796 RepID=A0ABS5AS05_9PSEU|nr:amidohydrolase family protein [Crossiella equi]MBP2479172.1 N-acetylglucosamine-6-phosphate deacetylase [Crossiella equi]